MLHNRFYHYDVENSSGHNCLPNLRACLSKSGQEANEHDNFHRSSQSFLPDIVHPASQDMTMRCPLEHSTNNSTLQHPFNRNSLFNRFASALISLGMQNRIYVPYILPAPFASSFAAESESLLLALPSACPADGSRWLSQLCQLAAQRNIEIPAAAGAAMLPWFEPTAATVAPAALEATSSWHHQTHCSPAYPGRRFSSPLYNPL